MSKVKVNWKRVAWDAFKAALAVVIGALAGSCTVYHLGITSVNVPDSTFVQKVDSSIKSWTIYKDSVINHIQNDFRYDK